MRSSIVPPSIILAFAALALTGCNNSDSIEAKNESAEKVAEKVAKSDIKPRPGRWESTLKIERMDMPNLPAEARAAMSQRMGEAQKFATCLTPEDVAKPDASFFQGAESGCTYERFTMANGAIDASMICDHAGRTQKTTMTGTYGADSYAIKVASTGEAQPGMPMEVSMSIASRRVGDCNGKEDT